MIAEPFIIGSHDLLSAPIPRSATPEQVAEAYALFRIRVDQKLQADIQRVTALYRPQVAMMVR